MQIEECNVYVYEDEKTGYKLLEFTYSATMFANTLQKMSKKWEEEGTKEDNVQRAMLILVDGEQT